jgi:hypothetical protein
MGKRVAIKMATGDGVWDRLLSLPALEGTTRASLEGEGTSVGATDDVAGMSADERIEGKGEFDVVRAGLAAGVMYHRSPN